MVWLYVLALFVSVWYVPLNIMKGVRGRYVPWWNFAIMAASVTGVVTHIQGLW